MNTKDQVGPLIFFCRQTIEYGVVVSLSAEPREHRVILAKKT